MESSSINRQKAIDLANKYRINLDVVPIAEWEHGLNIELEHGQRNNITNITNDDLDMTVKIAIAHLLEDPRYYYHLSVMESDAEKYWNDTKKPNIFIDVIKGGYYHKYQKYKQKYHNLKK